MYKEVNTRTNLPAQIELYATNSNQYDFLFIAKGGGSANKTFLYQQTKALLNPEKLLSFVNEKIKVIQSNFNGWNTFGTPVWQHTFVSPSAFTRRAVVSYWLKYVHEVLVNRLGGLSLPRKSVVRLTDRPNMTLDVYRGSKTIIQPTNLWNHENMFETGSSS